MNNNIRTHVDLLREKERLEALLDAQKDLIQLDIQGIKTGLKPATNIVSFVGSMGKKAVTNPLLGIAVGLSTDILMRKFFLKRAGWVVKAVLPFVIKKVTNKVSVNPGKPSLFGRIIKKII